MKSERLFILKAIDDSNRDEYVKKFISNFSGYFFTKTKNIKNAQQWKYRKNCERVIMLLTTQLNPTKYELKKYKSFEIIEVTDIRTLRKLKLRRINKLSDKKKL